MVMMVPRDWNDLLNAIDAVCETDAKRRYLKEMVMRLMHDHAKPDAGFTVGPFDLDLDAGTK